MVSVKRLLLPLVCIAALLLVPAVLSAAEESPTPVKVLPNGLVVLVKENHAAPVSSVRVSVRTGSMYEGKYLGSGISHLCEHIVSGGTTRFRVESQYDAILQELGNNHNASTSNEVTEYYIDTTGDNVYKALDILSEWTLACAISWPEWYREMGVINREIERGQDSPERTLAELADQTMFKVHPTRFPVAGYKHLFNKITYQDVLDYYNERYVPNNMVVAVVGDFDAAKVREYVAKAFSKKDAKPIPAYELPAEPEQIAPRTVVAEKEGVQGARMRLGFRTVSLMSPDMYPLDVLSDILSNGESSRLVRVLRDEKQLVQTIATWSHTPSWEGGEFGVYATLETKKLDEAREAILAELYRLQDELVTDAELKKAKTQKAAELAFGRQTVGAQANDIGGNYLSCFDPDFSRRYVDNIQKVTAEQVRDVAKKYFRPEKLCVTVLVPKGEAGAAAEKTGVVPVTPIRRVVLETGVTLLVRRNGAAPIVTIHACLTGGLRAEDRRSNGVSQLMAAMLTRGTTTRSAQQIADAFEAMGGDIGAGSGANSFNLTAGVLAKDVDAAMEVFADVLLNPSFPADEFQMMKNRTIFGIRRGEDNPMTEAARFFRQNMYLTSPYGMMPAGTVASVTSLTRDDLVQFHQRYVHPKNMVLAIFGDVDPAQAEELARKYFGGFRGDGAFRPARPALEGPLTGPRVALKVNKKEGAVVYMGAPGPQMTDVEDRAVIDVIDTVMSGWGYPGGWLHSDLRGRQLVYEVHAFSTPGVEPGYFAAYARCQPDKVKTVAEAILYQVYRMALYGPTPQEMDLAKQMIVTTEKLENQTSAAQAMNAAINELYGLGYDFDERQLRRIQGVTLGDIQKVARKYFTTYVLTVTAPDEHIADGVTPKPVIVKAN